MQDNRLQKEKDGAFEDKAWMDMRKLLDKEMPVRKRDRYLFWWWGMAGILLLLVMLGSLFVFNNKQVESLNERNIATTNKPSIITKKEKQVLVPNKNDLNKNTQTEKKEIISIDQQTLHSKEELKSLKIIELKENSNNKIPKGTAHSTALENRIYPNVIDDASMNLQNAIINPRKALEEITHSSFGSPPFNEEEKVSLIEQREQVIFNHLPILELMDLPIVSNELIFPKYAIPKKSRMDWAIVASLGTFKLTRFNEYGIGLKTSYQLHPKWKLGTGLNYHYFRLNGLVKVDDSIKSLDEEEIVRTMEPSAGTAGTASTAGDVSDTSEADNMDDLSGSNTEQVFVDPLALGGNGHYVSMPFFVEYQASSKVKLDIGVAYYYSLATSYDAADNRLKPSDWTSFIGLGYECTSYFDLRLSYERNWSKQRSNSVNTDFVNANSFDVSTDKEAISPLEGRLKISGIWRF